MYLFDSSSFQFSFMFWLLKWFIYIQVSVFLIVVVVLAGAGLGYWVVRKFILSADGRVDSDIARFVLWAMRVIALFFILQV
jgi:NEMP family